MQLLVVLLVVLLPALAHAQTQWHTDSLGTRELRFYQDPNPSSPFVGLRAPSGISTYTCTMPPNPPAVGSVLSVDSLVPGLPASCTLSWLFSSGGGASGTLMVDQLVLGSSATQVKALLAPGTPTTVLHGNPFGPPTFGPVNLATDVSGNLPVNKLNSGTLASSVTYWRGDGTWATPAGVGTVTNSGTLADNAFSLGAGGTVVKTLPITGLVVGHGVSAPTAYPGASCAGGILVGLDAFGAASCAPGAVGPAGTNALVTVDTAGTISLVAGTGNENKVLHGGPTIHWDRVHLDNNDVVGLLPISRLNATGTPSSTTFLRGDGAWATPAGGGGGLAGTGTAGTLMQFTAPTTAGDATGLTRPAAGVMDATTRYQIGGQPALSFGSTTDTVLVGVAGLANTGNNVTMVGHEAGGNNSANNSAFFGYQAGRDNTTGVDNTFVGSWAGQQNTTAAEGVFLGTWAGQANTTGGGNTYLGYMAGRLNIAGQQNTYVGWGVRSQISTGSFNTFVGYQTGGETAVSGDHNTAIGIGAGQFNGNWNTAIGQNAGGSGTAYNSSLALGAGAVPTGSNQAVIGGDAAGNGNITAVFLGQGVTHATPAAVTLRTTGGSGANIAGAPFNLAPGVGTGSATPSSIGLFTSSAGVGGTTPQANAERWRINGAAGGNLTAMNGANLVIPTQAAAAGLAVLQIDATGLVTKTEVATNVGNRVVCVNTLTGAFYVGATGTNPCP
jgi:hypothetical protein